MINQIIARMKAEGATSATSNEIKRCLKGCVSGSKLIDYAMANRIDLCIQFCDENTNGCDCDIERIERDEDWERTEMDKLENRDITF